MGFAVIGAALFAAWALGANNSAGCMGTSVGCGLLPRRYALALFVIFLAMGAVFEGWKNMNTVGRGLVVGLSGNPSVNLPLMALLALLVSAVIVTVSTLLAVPMSMSQTAVGAMIGSGIALLIWGGGGGVWINTELMLAVFISWILNPFVSACLAFFASRSIAVVIRRMGDLTEITRLMFVGLIVTSAFTAYTFGANDLGASTGVFYAFFEDRGIAAASFLAAILAWVGTVAGAITLGRKVSRTVESGITRLDPFTAFSAQLGTAIGVWAFVQFHIPVSTTQAFVGGLMGAGMAKGVAAVNSKKLGRIAMTWIIAPVLALLISLALSLAVLS